MPNTLVFFCLCCSTGVFGVEVKSVSEGDSVTLHTDVRKIRKDDDILWKYGAENSLIAEISRATGIFSTYDHVPDGRFRHRLKLDNKTGSLTITNTTTEHTGDYQLQITGAKLISKTFSVSVFALPVPVISRNSSQCPSSSCSVMCSVVNVSHVTLSWLKGNSLLSSISVSDLSISLSLPLVVKDQDTNNYRCVLNNSITHQTTHLDISGVCQTCPVQDLPSFHIVLISASASLLIVVVLVLSCICKKCRTKDTSVITELQTEEIDETHSALCKPKARKTKPKGEALYENVPKRR